MDLDSQCFIHKRVKLPTLGFVSRLSREVRYGRADTAWVSTCNRSSG
jgi:hypothetical protein